MTASRSFPRVVAAGLVSAAVVWTAALLVVGLSPSDRLSPVLGGVVYAAGSRVCHQRPERSFHTHGRQFPVCARCTGLYLAGTLGALLGWPGRPRVPRYTRILLAAAAGPTAVTVGAEWLDVASFSNLARALSAVPLGASAGWLFVRMLRAESRPSTCAMIA